MRCSQIFWLQASAPHRSRKYAMIDIQCAWASRKRRTLEQRTAHSICVRHCVLPAQRKQRALCFRGDVWLRGSSWSCFVRCSGWPGRPRIHCCASGEHKEQEQTQDTCLQRDACNTSRLDTCAEARAATHTTWAWCAKGRRVERLCA